jgi:hypothetical protein
MSALNDFYAPDIAAKAVIELTGALKLGSHDEYARALLSDPRMVSNRGHLASCGVNMRKVRQAKDLLGPGIPTMVAKQKAIEFLNSLDQEQESFNG